ncbi:MAG: hypothetical protein KF791_07335 [Verrucomicrobiae bacterium]|nr:hypothetical protein [Verrucomicrobiae bacterium]
MKRTVPSLLAALLGAGTLTLTAQNAPERPSGPQGRPHPPGLGVLDANQDGFLDATEIAQAADVLAALDANGDGQLTPDELQPRGRGRDGGRPGRPGDDDARPAGGPRRGGPGGGFLIVLLDVNRDGILDATEIAAAPAALAALDADGDGVLSVEEVRPARPEGAPGEGRGPGGKRGGPRGPRPPGTAGE